MAKIIIPKSALPTVSDELTNKFRYRIINKNRNLYSQWSVIGEIKRALDQADFNTNTTSYSIDSSISNRIDGTWYTADINQEFDIYVRYKLSYFSVVYGTFYFHEPLSFLGRKNTNYVSINPLPLSNRISIYSFGNYSAQIMVKLPEYPRIESLSVNVDQFDRKVNYLRYWLQRDVPFSAGDYVNITLNNNNAVTPFEDNSLFAGIKRVYSVGDDGDNSFKVESTGPDISLRSALDLGAANPNTVAKINGQIQFVTDDIVFT